MRLIVSLFLIMGFHSVVLLVGASSTTVSSPNGTTEGNYALHLKTTTNNDSPYVWAPLPNWTIVAGRTYSFKVSVFIAASNTNALPFFETDFELPSQTQNNEITVAFDNCFCYLGDSIYFHVGRLVEYPSRLSWSSGTWYNLEITLTNDAASIYVNDTLVLSASGAAITGSFIEQFRLYTNSAPVEVFVDRVSVSEDNSVLYSEGFEQGLSNVQVTERGAPIVDTVYFGQGVRLSSTIISLPGFEAPLGSNVLVEGTVRNATSLGGAGSVAITFEASYSGSKFEAIGSTTSDRYGNFGIYWRPSQMGDAYIRAVSSENCCFFRSSTSMYVSVSRAVSQLSLSLSSSTNLLGYSVVMNGTLNGIDSAPISQANVLLEFTVPGASGWTTITSATTGTDGRYQATWLPQATGSFTVRASWAGDGPYRPTSTSTILTSTSYGSRYVFSVASNASVSSPVYDSNAGTLSFILKGADGKMGYTEVSLPKDLVPDASRLKLQVNGTDISFQSVQSGDVVRIHFAFVFHSSLLVLVYLGEKQVPPPGSPNGQVFSNALYGGIGAVAILSVVFLVAVRRKKQRKVASPLEK